MHRVECVLLGVQYSKYCWCILSLGFRFFLFIFEAYLIQCVPAHCGWSDDGIAMKLFHITGAVWRVCSVGRSCSYGPHAHTTSTAQSNLFLDMQQPMKQHDLVDDSCLWRNNIFCRHDLTQHLLQRHWLLYITRMRSLCPVLFRLAVCIDI